VQAYAEPATNPEFVLSQNDEADMSHWRKKRNPPASQFNPHLSGWALALTALVGTLVLLSLHQYT
jgi:hypothetical protein